MTVMKRGEEEREKGRERDIYPERSFFFKSVE